MMEHDNQLINIQSNDSSVSNQDNQADDLRQKADATIEDAQKLEVQEVNMDNLGENRDAILLNVDSTVLKLEDSNLSTESVQEIRAPIELAMQLQRLNETENETAAFNMAKTGQVADGDERSYNVEDLEQANIMNQTFQEMEMRATKISMKVGMASVEGSLSGEETDELEKF